MAGRPFLAHQLQVLHANGVQKVVLCVGHLGQQIAATIGTNCEGISIDYSYDGPNLDGTLGAVRRAASKLEDRFLIMYGDTYLRLDYHDFYGKWMSSGLPAGMTVYRNDDRLDKSNVVYRAGLVELYSKTMATGDMHWIDYGLCALTRDVLEEVPPSARDLSFLFNHLSRRSQLFGYEVSERFYEIGTPGALAETAEFLNILDEVRRSGD